MEVMVMAKNKGTSNELAPVAVVDDTKAAAFKMSPHLVQLMLNEPFYAGVLRGVNFVKTDAIPTPPSPPSGLVTSAKVK